MEKFKHTASVSNIIYNDTSEILFVSSNNRDWEAIGGWLENETINDCINRELYEELGKFNYQIVDIIDTHTFKFSNSISLISIWSLIKYIDGQLIPNDDITGYILKWFNKSALESIDIKIPKQIEIIQKAFFLIELYQKNQKLPFMKYNWKEIS